MHTMRSSREGSEREQLTLWSPSMLLRSVAAVIYDLNSLSLSREVVSGSRDLFHSSLN
ncbi:hypothetical protein Mapa_014776 [Marchantia paleacea]|nr:hypothetical protein Mapa_014776 [Marchantia paleacea]